MRSASGLRRPRAAPRRPGRAHGARPLILAGGLLLLAAAVALAIVALTGGDECRRGAARERGGRDRSDGRRHRLVHRVARRRRATSRWARARSGCSNNEARTVSRIDPETKEVSKSVRDARCAERARGRRGGALDRERRAPEISATPRSACPGSIPTRAGSRGRCGSAAMRASTRWQARRRIAVGAGAVWAANPDGSVSRIDAETGRIVATIDTDASAWTIAAGDGGVWFLGSDEPSTAVTRIDPRRNRVTRRIPVGASNLAGVAVGAGSVWAAASDEGVVWRIDPGRPPLLRTIDVGKGVSFVAFGEGARLDGQLHRRHGRPASIPARTTSPPGPRSAPRRRSPPASARPG